MKGPSPEQMKLVACNRCNLVRRLGKGTGRCSKCNSPEFRLRPWEDTMPHWPAELAHLHPHFESFGADSGNRLEPTP